MRISDWSSDVCSSDLLADVPVEGPPRLLLLLDCGLDALALGGPGLGARRRNVAAGHRVEDGALVPVHPVDADRKSVVSGKSVSVRVDLGGRRIIKKKTT